MRSAILAAAGAVLAAGVFPAAASLGAGKGVEHHSDFGVTLSGPKETSLGGRATYEMEATNNGPDATEAKLRFNQGTGATVDDFDEGRSIRTASQSASQGDCVTDSKGVLCKFGTIRVGETADVKVVMKVTDAYEGKDDVTVQATVAPELVPAFDTNDANDHEELTTEIRAPIAVDGLPEGCATRPFKAQIQTDVPAGKRTKVLVDGKVLDTSAAEKFKVTVKPDDLDKGSHKLSVVVQSGSGGALAKLDRRFKTC
jgi:hypothetical protein